MTAAERRELRGRVVSYMEYHPLPNTVAKAAARNQASTEPYREVSIPFFNIFKYAGTTALILFAAVPYLAERSVPGDTLYAVKVGFNEELRSTLTFSAEERIVWETERLNRRIAEAQLLASEGKLTEEVEAEVVKAVQTHTENAQKEIENLRTTDEEEAAIASIELTSTLKAQSNTLQANADLATAASTTPTGIKLAESIAASVIETGEAASSSMPSYERMVARIELQTTRMYELFSSISGNAEPVAAAEVERRIEDTERTIAAAAALYEDDAEAARIAMVAALEQTQRLLVFMTNMEVFTTVDVESIVPMVLTEAEKRARIQEMLGKLAAALQQLESVEVDTDATEESGVVEKFAALTERMEVMVAALEATLAEARFSDGVAKQIEASALVKDAAVLVDRYGTPGAVTEAPATAATTATSATTTDAVATTSEAEIGEPSATSSEEATEEESGSQDVVEEVSEDETSTDTVDSEGDVSATTSDEAEIIACTEDARVCPDGSVVGRTGPSCEFVCPAVEATTSEVIDTSTEIE